MPAFILIAWKVVKPILTFGITLPIWCFLIAGGWLWWDRTSAVRTAVDNAVTRLVAGAEIDALNAKLAEEQRHRTAAVQALKIYQAKFAEDSAAAEQANDLLEQRITTYEKQLAASGRSCALNDADIEWLRNASKKAQ